MHVRETSTRHPRRASPRDRPPVLRHSRWPAGLRSPRRAAPKAPFKRPRLGGSYNRLGCSWARRTDTHRAAWSASSMPVSRLQQSMLQLLASAVLLVVVYIVATPTDVPRSALLQPAAVMDSAAPAHKASAPITDYWMVEHLEKGARLQKRLSQKEYRTAQLLLAHLERGRHQQKKRRAQSRGVSLVMDSAAPAHKAQSAPITDYWMVEHLEKGARLQKRLSQKEYHTAQLLLAHLERGRHQQKKRSQEHLVRSSLAGVPSSSRAMRLQVLAAPDTNGPPRAAQHGSTKKTRHGGWYKCGKGRCYAPPSAPLSPRATKHAGGGPLLLLPHRTKKHHRAKKGWYRCGKGLCWRGAPVPKLPAADEDDEDREGGGGDGDGPVLPFQTTEADGREEDDEDEDGGEDEEDDELDLGKCSLPNSDDSDYASKMQKIENGEMSCCPDDGQWKAIGEPCGDEEEEHKEPTW